jgi:hypothetical protein
MFNSKYIKAYTSVEREFVEDYLFHSEEYNFFDNIESAKEDMELFKEESDFTYILDVNIKNNLFNIHKQEHRTLLYKHLPKITNVGSNNINKDLLMCYLMGNINKDQNEIETEEDTDYLFSFPVKEIIKNLGYNGFISMFEQLSKYTVFQPNKNIQINKVILK